MSLRTTAASIALALALGACSLGGMLGGGKAPTTLMVLTPEAPDPGQIARTAAPGQAVTIAVPHVSRELNNVRVPVQVNPVDVQYVTDLTLADTPDRLFAGLLAETVRRTTNRVVVNPEQTGVDPGLTVTGVLQRFGYDAATGQVIVQYDGSLAVPGGNRVETRRFTASAPADGTAATVGPALNRAANQVALDVAKWIGGSGS
ncbi:MAG TPA: ABC-type transport auxiliary lipoprotein family protein [Sphingomicrobium sp.]|jgi:cholesterol transport system auxiliary component|nr:ABC-type transport auxiliary lipoprotein family protein [Sphingomicrobium sp.]